MANIRTQIQPSVVVLQKYRICRRVSPQIVLCEDCPRAAAVEEGEVLPPSLKGFGPSSITCWRNVQYGSHAIEV